MPTTPCLKGQHLSTWLADFGPVEHNKGKSKDLRETYRKIYLKGCVMEATADVCVGLAAALEASCHLYEPGTS